MRQVDDVRCRNADDGTPEVERGAPAQEIHGLLTSGRRNSERASSIACLSTALASCASPEMWRSGASGGSG
jgi:hypothetical protein